MEHNLTLFATAPRGMAPLLAGELTDLGAIGIVERPAGVEFHGPLALAYRACLWSRVANRILLPLADFPAADPEALYRGVQSIDWSEHLAPDATLAVDFTTGKSAITHSRYGAQKVKDAVVDQFRERHGERPSVDTWRPDLRINVYLHRDHARIAVDLSGESLHRRGYREAGAAAPLKENLAAAILLRAGWPEIAAAGGALVDPLCGSGTLPIEAALIAADIAPGLLREHFGFLGWRGHRPEYWEPLLEEARERRAAGVSRLPPIVGSDADAGSLQIARSNAEHAGLAGYIRFEQQTLPEVAAPQDNGLVVANPPYGERLGAAEGLERLYADLGTLLRERFTGWRAAVFTGNPPLGLCLGLKARRSWKLFNGPIECRLLLIEVAEENFVAARGAPGEGQRLPSPASGPLSAGAEALANRLRKNLKHFGRWARREGVDCYRLYDADLPEYALAIDLYRGERLWVHVQEYAPPASIEPKRARERLAEALRVIPEVLEIPAEYLFFKVRERQRGSAQYTRQAQRGEFHEVREGPCRLLVNFSDYLDTGLFLDHRITRTRIGGLARGRRFLNLFCYTGAATVHAAQGGARETTSVDMSATYLEWARRNLALNGFAGPGHRLLQADCLAWLEEAAGGKERYGLIFLDPPSFSNSKRMEGTLDIQRDHPQLIRTAATLLEPDGLLFFSNNLRRFRLDEAALTGLSVKEISAATLPPDFARNPKIHRCWEIRRQEEK